MCEIEKADCGSVLDYRRVTLANLQVICFFMFKLYCSSEHLIYRYTEVLRSLFDVTNVL